MEEISGNVWLDSKIGKWRDGCGNIVAPNIIYPDRRRRNIKITIDPIHSKPWCNVCVEEPATLSEESVQSLFMGDLFGPTQ